MAIAAVLSSASTTNIRWFLWLFYFLSLFMSQSCLADYDQFNFNLGRHFSRKLCPGRCSMKFELQPFFRDSTVSESMHLIASSNPKRNRASKMYLSVSAAALVLIAVSSTWHMRRRDSLFEEEQENIRETEVNRSGNDNNSHDNSRRESENQMVSERRPLSPLDVIRKFKKYLSFETKIRNQVEFQGLPSFPLKVILKATQQFSDDRILGNGCFGVVYKGQLDDGGLIAVKRLSPSSQFAESLINEVSTLSHLQHKNVVKILGYCIERDEKLLIYKFMSNRSLDYVLFGSSMDIRLAEWKTRKNIINGIARGLLYLHEDSRLKIIHRDIKPSNVLLDDNMNPNISDFGLAKIIFDEDEIQEYRIAGTFGYMAPEYAMHGQLSVKTDVYSFGVLLLEIITGKKNQFRSMEHEMMDLQQYVWKLWCEGQALDSIVPALKQSCENYNNELMRCIHIGLLCVQNNPTDRPTMSSVVVMLASNDVNLPQPTRPAFCTEDISASEGSILSLTSNEGEYDIEYISASEGSILSLTSNEGEYDIEYISASEGSILSLTSNEGEYDIEYISASEGSILSLTSNEGEYVHNFGEMEARICLSWTSFD